MRRSWNYHRMRPAKSFESFLFALEFARNFYESAQNPFSDLASSDSDADPEPTIFQGELAR